MPDLIEYFNVLKILPKVMEKVNKIGYLSVIDFSIKLAIVIFFIVTATTIAKNFCEFIF